MNKLTYITTCKGRLSHLQQSLPRIVEQQNVECIVVDYACPDRCGDWVEAHFPKVAVVRSGPLDGFNVSKARNMGAAAARTAWIGFFDADILLAPTFAATVIPALKIGNFYRAHPVTLQSWGSLICNRNDFKRIGGYDETYIGWGGEDDDLIQFLLLNGIKQVGFPADLLSEIFHTDEQRTRFYLVQDKWLQSQINQLYLQAKLDIVRLRGVPLVRHEAVTLYSEIQRALKSGAGAKEGESTIRVTFPPSVVGSPPRDAICQLSELQRTLSYTVRITGTIADPGPPVAKIDII